MKGKIGLNLYLMSEQGHIMLQGFLYDLMLQADTFGADIHSLINVAL